MTEIRQPNPPRDEMENVLQKHLLLDLYNAPSILNMRNEPDFVEEPAVVEEPGVVEEVKDDHIAATPMTINNKFKESLKRERERTKQKEENERAARERDWKEKQPICQS